MTFNSIDHASIVKLLAFEFLLATVLIAQSRTGISDAEQQASRKIVVSENGRFLQYEDGAPFFWLADTGWLLFEKLTREEAVRYLENRRAKGFNVIQCMVVPTMPLVNIYGDSAFVKNNLSRPCIIDGKDFADAQQYDFWDHVEYIIDEAAKNGIRVALVPLWGKVAKQPETTVENVTMYARWLAKRFGSKPNIFWINGGDLRGDIRPEIWKAIGTALKANDPNHLITYHPFGRTQSSTWFHNEPWLDFNMFQSGHRRYDQLKGDGAEIWKGEDNWRYVLEDYAKHPPKPTLDGEPSYENIPQGLHDTTEPYWNANDCRRYAYWSVFAGSCGHTYGDNAVMQMHKPAGSKNEYNMASYGVKNYWYEAIDDSGSFQMCYVANLMLSRPYFERVFDSTLIIDQGTRYDFVAVTRGKSYLFAYTFTGRPFTIVMGKISGKELRTFWYNPRDGTAQFKETIKNSGAVCFKPPGVKRNGNDWVLVIDDASQEFSEPGSKIIYSK
jgi:hypothetical protein